MGDSVGRDGQSRGKKIIFLVTEDWYFVSHRLHLAVALIEKGYDVLLAARFHRHRSFIEAKGIRVIPVDIRRESRNVARELKTIFMLVKAYLREKPDLVHHVATKPILYGSVAAMAARLPVYVNAFAGLGFVFMESESLLKKWAKRLFLVAYQMLFLSKAAHAIFQNPDDKALFEKLRIVRKQNTVLIRGAGVDTRRFVDTKEPRGPVTIVLGARMLWDKGIGELVEASAILQARQVACRILLAGIPDPANPKSIPEETLNEWQQRGYIEWIGFRQDMAQVFAGSHIAVLPSYREGVPKFLLEAASCGRPIITTDVAGCREVVKHNVNGLLVPVKDSKALASALQTLVENPGLRKRMGKKGRVLIKENFSDVIVNRDTVRFYQNVLSKHNRRNHEPVQT